MFSGGDGGVGDALVEGVFEVAPRSAERCEARVGIGALSRESVTAAPRPLAHEASGLRKSVTASGAWLVRTARPVQFASGTGARPSRTARPVAASGACADLSSPDMASGARLAVGGPATNAHTEPARSPFPAAQEDETRHCATCTRFGRRASGPWPSRCLSIAVVDGGRVCALSPGRAACARARCPGDARARSVSRDTSVPAAGLTGALWHVRVCTVKANGAPWEAAARVAQLLLTGAFVLGITAVSGGVVAAGQFRSIGLSGSETVAALRRAELLARGADHLLPFALAAAAAAIATYAISGATGGRGIRVGILVTAGALFVGLALTLKWQAGWPRESHELPWWGSLGVVLVGVTALGVIGTEVPVDGDDSVPGEKRSQVRLLASGAVGATVIVFGVIVGYPHAFEPPHHARAAALELRSSHRILTGVWGAANGDWVFIGRLQGWSDDATIQGHILSVSREDVAAFEFSRQTTLSAACRQLPDLIRDIEAAAPLPQAAKKDQPAAPTC